MKNMIIASTSTLHGGGYLEYLLPHLDELFSGCKTILFIPFARPGGLSHEDYTEKVRIAFSAINKEVINLDVCKEPDKAIQNAEAIFTGGGNTFLLVSELYRRNLLNPLAAAISRGTPYLGTSAGSNITGISMQNTNDMPIVYPPSFTTLGILPFNLNVHYLDADPNSTHMGESRETRISEFHDFNDVSVLGLREGSWLKVEGSDILLKGDLSARLFQSCKLPVELLADANLNFIQ